MQGIPDVTVASAGEYGVRCAYCEEQIVHASHIEHFRRKNPQHFPELCFDWDNLFLACGSKDHCGHYKDRSTGEPYNPALLIKPDEHDPEHYLYFHSSGQVRVRNGLNPDDTLRGNETIRVFGLNSPALVALRARALRTWTDRTFFDDLLEELMSWDDADRQTYLRGEIAATRWDEYATTIKHFLQN